MFEVTQFAILCYSSSRNWYSSLSPHFCLLSFTKTPNCFFCRPSSDHQRNLLIPTSDHILLCSGPSKASISLLGSLPTAQRPVPSTSPCSLSSDTLVFLLFLQPASSAPSSGLPAADPSPRWLCDPYLHVTQTPLGTSFLERLGCHSHSLFGTSVPIRTGAPWRQSLVLLLHTQETWAGRLATGDTSREGISDPGARLPNLTSGVNGRCSLGKLCMRISWIPTDLRISNL